MAHFAQIKPKRDADRFPARDEFLISMEQIELQKIFQGASFLKIPLNEFNKCFKTIESAAFTGVVDDCINQLFNRFVPNGLKSPLPSVSPSRSAAPSIFNPTPQPQTMYTSNFSGGLDIGFQIHHEQTRNRTSTK